MGTAGLPQTRDFYRPWGFDYNAYSRARQDYDRQRDMDYFEKWGFFPEQRAGTLRAAQRGEQDFSKALESLGGYEREVMGGPMATQLQDYYTGIISGKDQPFTPGVLASIASRITDPFYRSARNSIGSARANFAARGLERSGGLVGLEQQYLQEAIARAISEEGNIRTQGALENFQARERGAAGMQGYLGQRNTMLGNVAGQRADLYANRQHDPIIESMRGAKGSLPLNARGDETPSYSPPPDVRRRTVGRSAPVYDFGRMSARGGALGGY